MLFRLLSLLPAVLSVQVRPSDPHMYVEGRHVLLPGGDVVFDNACVTMNLVFRSTSGGSVKAKMTPNNNSFRVKIYNQDGLFSERLFFTASASRNRDEVETVDMLEGKSLPAGVYHMKLVKTTEASDGGWHIHNWAVTFENFEVEGYTPLPASESPLALPKFQVEIWGDSGTTGIGAHAPMELRDTDHGNDNALEDDDCSVGFQAMMAKELNMELHNVGRGGTVIADPKDGIPTRLMAALNAEKQYRHDWSPLHAIQHSESRSPLGSWAPDLVIVYGGANDYGGSKGDETELEGGVAGTPSFSEFRAAYSNFLYSIASAYTPVRPSKKLVLLNLCGGFESQGDNFVCPHVARAVEEVVFDMKAAPVDEALFPHLHIEYLQFPEGLLDESVRTAGNHFTVEGHERIHLWLTPLVKRAMEALYPPSVEATHADLSEVEEEMTEMEEDDEGMSDKESHSVDFTTSTLI